MTYFDPTKPVQTRDGRKARIVCTNARIERGYPIAALVETEEGGEEVRNYTKSGLWIEGARLGKSDLINIPEVAIRYVNIYEHDPEITVKLWRTREKADNNQYTGAIRTGCKRIEIPLEPGYDE